MSLALCLTGRDICCPFFIYLEDTICQTAKTGCFTERDNELYNDLHYGCFKLCMVIFMTIVMTVFSVAVSGLRGTAAIADFFTYLPYNFTIALPIQMIVVAPLSFRLSEKLCESV